MSTCDCWRLTRTLLTGEPMPAKGHVCEETCHQTCKDWLYYHWPLPLITSLVNYSEKCARLHEWDFPPYMVGELPLAAIPEDVDIETTDDSLLKTNIFLAEGVYAQCDTPETWPIKVLPGHSHLRLILRAEVAEQTHQDKKRGLQTVSQMEKNANWQTLHTFLSHPPNYRNVFGEQQVNPLRAVQELLARYSLPATQATAHYLLWRLNNPTSDLPPVWPARGVQITTFCLSGDPAGQKSLYGQTLSRLECSGEWVTNALMRDAAKVMHSHAEWWRSIGLPVQQGDMRKENKRRREPDAYDSLVQAVLRAEITDQEEIDRRINQICDAMSRQSTGIAASPTTKREARQMIKKRITAQRKRSR